MKTVMIDTGVWYAIFDSRDSYYKEAKQKNLVQILEKSIVVIPWPTVYETLRTRFVKNALSLDKFERFLKTPNVKFIQDEPFRNAAFYLCFESSLRKHRPLSMVDCLIRLMLEDDNIPINSLATFNKPDFIDICHKKRIEII